MSDDMGPTPNPSTQHYWDRDIYTHVQYSSYLEPKTDDGYGSEMEASLKRGDTDRYQRHFVILDSLKVNASMNEATRQMERVQLTAKLRIVNILGEEQVANPTYILEGNVVSHEDAFLTNPPVKIRFADLNTDTDEVKLTVLDQSKRR
ncbi:MAG: hypothetical protein U5L96_11460 [Owenweeksia sp.]|nr:hypothetical protein [Owenweeksia sp.]